jgi:uncharacterized protein (DUF1684 family)
MELGFPRPALMGLMAATIATSSIVRADAIDEQMYRQDVTDWRARAETSLKRDNGWLTLAGRYVMKPGENRFGTAPDNDIVFPAGTGPEHIGSFLIEPEQVTLKVNEGLTMLAGGEPVTSHRMGIDTDKRDWVSIGRLAMHVISRDGQYVLRLADNQSEVRERFTGRVWYDVNPAYRVVGKFVPYNPVKKISIVNVLGEISEEPSPGYVEFNLAGKTYRLDPIDDGDGELFFVFRDGTSGKGTYPPGRFLVGQRSGGDTVIMDFNRAYNPPCAFSEFTTCPLPPRENHLKVRVEAGERDYKKQLAAY